MNIHQLKPKTKRSRKRYVGRGGKKGTFSGKGTKGQKSRAGAYIRTGFRGGDNRIWQLFPKQRGASKKPGSSRPHPKHRYFILRQDKPVVLNLDFFNKFNEGENINPAFLKEQGLFNPRTKIKILGTGNLTRKLNFEGFTFSKSAQEKIIKSGGSIK